MTPRTFIGIVGALAAIGALVALLLPVKLDSRQSADHDLIACGNAFHLDVAAADQADGINKIGRTLTNGEDFYDDSNYVQDCRERVNTRRAWGYPLGIAALVAITGAVVIRKPKAVSPPTR